MKQFILSISILLIGLPIFAQQPVIYRFQVVNQQINDIVYAPVRRKIFASVPSTGGIYGNYVIEFDPYTRQITRFVFAGSEPNKLAISDDESTLYVGLDGSASVRKIILATMSADIQFGLGSSSNGLFYPEDIVVLQGQPDSIAVSRRNFCCSPRHEGVAIYDNGVVRQTVTPGHTGSNAIERGDSPGVLFGYNNESTDFGFRKMSVTSGGVSIVSNQSSMIQGSADIKYSRGRVYSTTGKVVNTATGLLDGSFSLSGGGTGIEIDNRSGRTFFTIGNQLQAFNSRNFQPTGTITLPNASHGKSRLLRWGRRGLAYRTDDSRLAVFQSSIVPAPPMKNDFDGDEISEPSVFRPASGYWFSASGIYASQFGLASDDLVASDYDGDGKTDLAVYRSGLWYIALSATGTVRIENFGSSGDVPLVADFDGDQRSDLAIFRNGAWWISRSIDGQIVVVNFGLGSDRPAPSDFDGDGKADQAIFRPSEGRWYVLRSIFGDLVVNDLGNSSAIPVPADYDGDGLSDFAVWQTEGGLGRYYIRESGLGVINEHQLDGNPNSIPVPGDYDADGIVDPCVLGPAGSWTSMQSRRGPSYALFGLPGDRPVSKLYF